MSSPLAWTEVRVLVKAGWQELVADALTDGPCTSVAFGRANLASPEIPDGMELVRTFLPARDDSSRARAQIVARLDDLAERAGAAELSGLEPTFHELPPEDYATSWKKSWHPFRIGRLCVVPPWREGPLRDSDVPLILEPGGVFGSGRHATTRMCLAAIQERVAAGERVLDAGCGTGILSVGAALFGAGHVLGFDIDPNAEHYANQLATDNSVAGRCEFRTGALECLTDEDVGFDGLLANIYSDVIQETAVELVQRMRSKAWFAFSGCPAEHLEGTRNAVDAAGFVLEEVRSRGRWRTLLGHRG